MKRIDIISHKGKQIIVLDISNTTPEEGVALFDEAHLKIAQYPPKSVLVFTDTTRAQYNEESVAAIKAFVTRNTPYVKASASVLTPGLQEMIHKSIERTATRNIRVFKKREDALDWLASVE